VGEIKNAANSAQLELSLAKKAMNSVDNTFAMHPICNAGRAAHAPHLKLTILYQSIKQSKVIKSGQQAEYIFS
jgi:hypothetical protein